MPTLITEKFLAETLKMQVDVTGKYQKRGTEIGWMPVVSHVCHEIDPVSEHGMRTAISVSIGQTNFEDEEQSLDQVLNDPNRLFEVAFGYYDPEQPFEMSDFAHTVRYEHELIGILEAFGVMKAGDPTGYPVNFEIIDLRQEIIAICMGLSQEKPGDWNDWFAGMKVAVKDTKPGERLFTTKGLTTYNTLCIRVVKAFREQVATLQSIDKENFNGMHAKNIIIPLADAEIAKYLKR